MYKGQGASPNQPRKNSPLAHVWMEHKNFVVFGWNKIQGLSHF